VREVLASDQKLELVMGEELKIGDLKIGKI
jgi:hypothetical protein